jgi:hypothetical protein
VTIAFAPSYQLKEIFMRAMMIAATLLTMASATVPTSALHAQSPGAGAWEIGPIIRSRNYSVGMPLRPTPSRRGWYFDFPYPSVDAGHVHYVTFNHGPLTGRSRIVMRYRVDAAPGVRFVSRETPGLPATISLYFQRRGDYWSGSRFRHYRWYAPDHTVVDLTPGEHQLSVSLNDSWISVRGEPVAANPLAYREAIADTGRVGFVLGTRAARGHGVYATGPARLTVTSFQVL